ncbi:hypothetical protein DDZ13_02670 [Coraliomargarita sinensis]|uniref:Uncharacterized protein n=1 Tax=Coraliomargarita sinensis TaxID=2174842 RepID=A0A317ZH07_9BACT|nr:hypothetical protein DDZ13_02670 [Coraliomargarita sinensis]
MLRLIICHREKRRKKTAKQARIKLGKSEVFRGKREKERGGSCRWAVGQRIRHTGVVVVCSLVERSLEVEVVEDVEQGWGVRQADTPRPLPIKGHSV